MHDGQYVIEIRSADQFGAADVVEMYLAPDVGGECLCLAVGNGTDQDAGYVELPLDKARELHAALGRLLGVTT